MSEQPQADQVNTRLLAVLSLAGLAVVAWACVLAWAVLDLVLHVARRLS